MNAKSKSTSGGKKSGPPAGHDYPYPWVRLRSASSSPLIFSRMIGSVDPAATAGNIVAVYDRNDAFFGHGFYHDRSQIGLRMLSYDRATVDEAFFDERIGRALAWREQLMGSESETDVYRLVHAEGDGLSGLIAERYRDWIAMEVFSLGVFRRVEMFKEIFRRRTGIERFVVRADEHIERYEHFKVLPEMSDAAPKTVTVTESGVRFRVDLAAGHKTGFFCDQRDNRRRLATLCRDCDVLDGCCYTGGFGVYAMKAGGAKSVTAVDLDEKAIELAKANAKLNEVRISYSHADAFVYLRQMQANKRLFDVVVLDPPKFVPTRDDYRDGSQKYIDLNTLGLSVLKPGGLLVSCSCSGLVGRDDFLGMVKSAAGRFPRPLQILDQTGAGADHPVMANCPESGYLKVVWARAF